MKTLNKILIVALLFISIAIAGSCKKEEPFGAFILKIITHKPFTHNYEKLLLGINAVDIHYTDEHIGTAGWLTVSTRPLLFDMNGQNAGMTLASVSKLPPGKIDDVLLIPADNSKAILRNGKVVPVVFSNENEGLNISSNALVEQHKKLNLLLDIDMTASFQDAKDGTLRVEPHISAR